MAPAAPRLLIGGAGRGDGARGSSGPRNRPGDAAPLVVFSATAWRLACISGGRGFPARMQR
jgi:hypothetical protein